MTEDPYDKALVTIAWVVDADAREVVLHRLERAYRTVAAGGRLDVAAEDARWVTERLTDVVDRQLATGARALDRPTIGGLLRRQQEAA